VLLQYKVLAVSVKSIRQPRYYIPGKNYEWIALMGIQEIIYQKSPIFLQNFFVGLYGWKLKRERYSRNSAKFENQLLLEEFNSAAENRNRQLALFRSLIISAAKNTAYYRRYFLEKGIDPESLQSFDDLALLPVMEKSFIKENVLDFVDEKLTHQKKLIKFYTSGTTGSPLPVYSTPEFRSNHYAFFTRIRKRYGLERISKRATLFGRIIIPGYQVKPPFWRYDWAQKNLLMSSYHLSNEHLKHYVERLRSYRPDEIFSYPSSLYEIARYINENNLAPLPTKLVMTTAERLSQNQRSEIEKAFKCRVVNQYGCTEMAFFASECEHGTLHANPEHGFLEVLLADGSVSTKGSGELLATGFVNLAMPLIRYRVGDLVTLDETECQCGRNTQIISDLEGRVDDTIYKLDGTPVGRVDPIFKAGLNIKGACVIQDEQGNIEIKVVPAREYSEKDRQTIIMETKKRVGDMTIVVTPVDSLPKGSNGKFRAVVSNYKRSLY